MRFGQENKTFHLEQLAREVAQLSPQEHGFTHLALDNPAVESDTGRLQGWIIPAKDLNDVAGMPTSLGHHKRTYLAEDTDPFLQALLDEGAIIPGKSASPELGLRVDTEPVGYPHPDNPLWPGRTPGGSSGGAAAMVARGLVRAAHASDGGGSIRVPAAACGVVGFKPSGDDLGVQGFITTSVEDQAYLHDLPLQPAELAAQRPRIGVLTEPLFADVAVSPVMLTAVEQARTTLRSLGFDVVDIALDSTSQRTAATTFQAFQRIFTTRLVELDYAEGYAAWLRKKGQSVSPSQLADALSYASSLPARLAFEWRVDAICSPMLAFDPPPQGTFTALDHQDNFDEQTRWSPWGSLFNVARLPAICVPWPVPGRQPVGIQLGGITLNDSEVLSLAHVLTSR